MDSITAVGGLAAFCTTLSYFPQLKKCWQTGHTGDLSLSMFLVLSLGVALWVLIRCVEVGLGHRRRQFDQSRLPVRDSVLQIARAPGSK
jgi:uncharacterized protein with PQ loop repeat